ncbi:MAG: thioredoxin family protein, partial [Verrucomicrobiaceae bacterium]|nr:thioredoxin family protein [Verrucomicrobiaceae bacterium]
MTGPRLLLIAFAFVLLPASAATGADDPAVWLGDYPSAAEAARAEDKKLLIVFTGTDWIDICQKFHDEILVHPTFLAALSGRFILLKLEFPKDGVMPREEAARKKFLREAYQVRGFPSVVLTEAGGRPFGLNGYQEIGPAEYASQIHEIDAAHEACLAAFEEAASHEGVARAERLRRAVPNLPGTLMARYYRPEMEGVLRNDPEDSLQLRDAFGSLLAEEDYGKTMHQLGREAKWAEMVEVTERYISDNELKGEALQRALFNQAVLQRRMGDAKGERAVLEKIVSIDPASEVAL